jgi:hypothetical protein
MMANAMARLSEIAPVLLAVTSTKTPDAGALTNVISPLETE